MDDAQHPICSGNVQYGYLAALTLLRYAFTHWLKRGWVARRCKKPIHLQRSIWRRRPRWRTGKPLQRKQPPIIRMRIRALLCSQCQPSLFFIARTVAPAGLRPLLTFGCRGRCVGSKSVSGHSQSDVSEWHVSLLMRGLSNPSAVSSTHLKPRFIRTRILRIVY